MTGWIIAIGIVAVVIIAAKQKNDKLKMLKQKYDVALKGSDKKSALQAGRNYYSALRNGKLTMFDEQAITNDLSTMKE